ncbi:MAG: oligosaccharide flippase family protein [Steroidobacteraceae bacterium]
MKTSINAAWMVGARVTADIASFLLFVAISRSFGPEGIGTYSYGFAIATLVFVVGALGIDAYGIREYVRSPVSLRPDLLAELLGAQIGILGPILVVLCVYVWLTAESLVTAGVIAVLSAYQYAVALTRTLFIPANAHLEMSGPALIDLSSRLLAIGFAIVAITLVHAPLLLALCGFPLAGVVLVTAAVWSARRFGGELKITARWPVIRARLQLLWSFAAAEALVQVFVRIGLVTLTLVVGAQAAGLYATGLKFVEIALMPLIFAGLAVYPKLSSLARSNRIEFQQLSAQFLLAAVALTGLVIWGLYFIVPLILVPLLGARFEPTIPVLQQMTTLALVQAGEVVLVRLLLASDLQISRLRILAACTVLNIIVTIALVPQWHISAAIAANVAALFVLDLFYTRALPAAVKTIVKRNAFTLLSALLAAGVLTWLAHRWAWPYWLSAAAALLAFAAVAGVSHVALRGADGSARVALS